MVMVRRVESHDEAVWVGLMAELAALHGCATSLENIAAGFRFAVGHPEKFALFGAEADGSLIGIITLNLGHYSIWTNTWFGLIEDFIVAESHRRQGIGSMLISRVLEEARARNLSRLELYALRQNLPARSLYEKIGFESDSFYYHLYLR